MTGKPEVIPADPIRAIPVDHPELSRGESKGIFPQVGSTPRRAPLSLKQNIVAAFRIAAVSILPRTCLNILDNANT